MTNKKSARQAFVMSVVSLLLCCTMLVGTTFAWFTDEVVSSNNIIQSGTLDVEMYYGDSANAITNDASEGAIFNYDLWEPGYTQVKYVKIANVGNLAFQFRLDIIPTLTPAAGEVNLAEVIDVYMFDATTTVNRATIDAATPVGTLAQLMGDADGAAHGVLLPADGSTNVNADNAPRGEISYCIVLKMREEAGNEYQNLSVGGGFKVQLLATQYTWEKDSFDHTYDEGAEYNMTPVATVINQGPKTITATAGIGGATSEYEMPFTLQFLPNETLEQAQESSYRYWHADYVVKANQDVKAESIALAGYYNEWCQYNNDNWVAMIAGEDIAANTEIRLVELLGATVSYEEICRYGNDPEGLLSDELEGFLCGAVDLTGANAGTTITVELRLYEVPAKGECANGGGCTHPSTACEVGKDNYVVAGTYSYTFPAAEVSTMADLEAAIASGAKVIDAKGADLGDFNYDVVFQDGTVVKNAKLSYMYGGGINGDVTFENCEFVTESSYACHFDNGSGNIVFNNCVFDGWNSFGSAISSVEMNNCTFRKTYNYGILRFYQNAVLNNCTFESSFEGIDSNVTGTEVQFNNCTGIDGKIYNNGSVVGTWIVDGVDISGQVTSW